MIPERLRGLRWFLGFLALSVLTLHSALLAGMAQAQSEPAPADANTPARMHADPIYPGRGAMSAQDRAWMGAANPIGLTKAQPGSDPADQVCPRLATGSVVPAPAELKSQNGELDVMLIIVAVTDAQGLVRTCYVTDTGLLAPTLRLHPGDTLKIHFVNLLPSDFVLPDPDGMPAMHGKKETPNTNGFFLPCTGLNPMGPSTTNVHFHGLNVAPVCGQDEVVRTLIHSDQTFDYKVQIPGNEPPGLYWYHPHPHGFSQGQVQGGATGALIVEGLQSVDPDLAGLPERTFVLRDQRLPASERMLSDIPAWDLSLNYVPVKYPQYQPAVIQTNPEQKELWRFANTAADLIADLQFVVNGVAQPVEVVGVDGYPIAAGSSGQKSVTQTDVLLTPASRSEFVVMTPKVGDKAQLITKYWNTGPGGDYDPARPIADVVSSVGAEKDVVRLPQADNTAKKAIRFAGLAAATPVEQRTLYFSEAYTDPNDTSSPILFYITEEGQTPALYAMNQPPNIIVHSGTVEDWVIENRSTEDHAFHIHQIHFQVLEVDGQPVQDAALRDTVDIPYWSGSGPYHSVKVRMDFRDPNIIGKFVYHCHILEHEDGGMMGELEVLKPGSASKTAVTASTANLTPGASLTVSATVTDAATGKAAPTGQVQFQLNGSNLGDPVTLQAGLATLTATVNANAGGNPLVAFYQGDKTYTESLSDAVTLTEPAFVLSPPPGITLTAGASGSATVGVAVAANFAAPVNFTCSLPAAMTAATCAVSPGSLTGAGHVTLLVSTTAPSAVKRASNADGWLVSGAGASLAGVLLLGVSRRRQKTLSFLALGMIAAGLGLFMAGCGGAGKPSTPKGTYAATVMASSGNSSDTASVSIPITVD